MWKTDKNHNKEKLTALGVIIALLISLLHPATARAEGITEHVDIFVVSTETAVTAIWSTAIYQNRLYVKAGDFCRACGVSIKEQESSNGDYELQLGSFVATIPADSIVVDGEETWIPLEECLNKVYFSALFLVEERTLVLRRTGLDRLLMQMNAIYDNAAYKMASWQNMKEFGGLISFDNSYYAAVMVDMVTNFKYLNVATGSYGLEQYQSALEDIFLAEMSGESDGLASAIEDSQNIFKTIAGGKKDADNLFRVLFNEADSGFMGDFGVISTEFTKVADMLNLEGVVMTNRYLEMVGGVNVSYKNALEYIVAENLSNEECSRLFLTAAQDVLEILNENEPAWKSYLKQIVYGAGVKEIIAIKDRPFTLAMKDKVKMLKAVTAIEKKLINLAFHTDKQVNGTIKAYIQLDIQNMCRYAYNKWMQKYDNAADNEGKVSCLSGMRDITQLYLACGICAWQAVNTDADLANNSAMVVSQMQNAMMDLCVYTPECYEYYKFNQEACAKLVGAQYPDDITEDDLPGNSDLVKEILYLANKGYPSSKTEYVYTEDGLVERKREYYATEDTFQLDSMVLGQETVYTYDGNGRVVQQQIFDAEGELISTGTYTYDEECGFLTMVDFRDEWGYAIVCYTFSYQSGRRPMPSGEYIWNNFDNMYFNGNVKYVNFHFGPSGEIVECLAYSSGNFTEIPEYDITYTCDENGEIISETCWTANAWGSYSCEYERSSRGIENIYYYYLSGENMRLEAYQYDEKDRITSISVMDEEMGMGYLIKYEYY